MRNDQREIARWRVDIVVDPPFADVHRTHAIGDVAGNAEYLVEGLRFHMNGYWEISITINAGGDRDTIIIPLEL